jgi:hypothetical protein
MAVFRKAAASGTNTIRPRYSGVKPEREVEARQHTVAPQQRSRQQHVESRGGEPPPHQRQGKVIVGSATARANEAIGKCLCEKRAAPPCPGTQRIVHR